MSFFLRKSLRFGSIRFNLSKSGIGVSAGVKGLRIGSGPRGNYIYAGRNGIYYRKTLSGPKSRAISQTPMEPWPLEKGAVSDPALTNSSLVDETAAGLLGQLNRNRKRWRIWPAITAMFVITGGLLYAAVATGTSLQKLIPLVGATVALGLLIPIGIHLDRQRKTAVLFYDLEGTVMSAFALLHSSLEELGKCLRLSLIKTNNAYSDPRYHAGAVAGLDLAVVRVIDGPPSGIRTNISVLALTEEQERLYFFPDRLLVFRGPIIGAIEYSEISLSVAQRRFIDNPPVPGDAQVVGSTWKYVNKDGSPDLRFRGNVQLPVALYDELSISTEKGFLRTIQISKLGVTARFIDAVQTLASALRSHQTRGDIQV